MLNYKKKRNKKNLINIKERDKIYFIISKIKLNLERLKSFFSFKIIKIWICIILILFLFKKRINYKRIEALTRGKNYLKICLKEKIINNVKFKKSKEPKITIIVPLYNSEPYVKKSIRSIQNQSILDIEIILVNDVSTDNTLKIIEELQKEDPRIELINNEKNMGILYSRCIGVLKAKGKYIVPLDHDDFFLDDNVFEVIYEEAEKGDFDIISFMDIEIKSLYGNIAGMKDGDTTFHPDGLIIKQPELSYFPFFRNESYVFIDGDIWGKIYKTEKYKEAVNLLGKERYTVYNAFNEDQIALFAICIVAKSYKYVRKYGLFHTYGHQSALGKAKIEHAHKMEIFFTEIVFDLSKKENKKYSLFMALSFNFTNLDEYNKLYFKIVLKKILESKYIEKNLKEKLQNKYKEYSFLN